MVEAVGKVELMATQPPQSPIDVIVFTTSWRIARERLQQQQNTLAFLFAAAEQANSERPTLQPYSTEMTEADWDRFRAFFEESGIATGARDAYATAVVMVIDDILKTFWEFYDRIPGVPKTFCVGVNGVDIFTIFRAVGNNVRHYLDWRRPTHQIERPKPAYANVRTIATVVGRSAPDYAELSVMAVNWAWPVLHAAGGGTFAGLLAKVRECMDEVIHVVDMHNDPLVLDEIAKER